MRRVFTIGSTLVFILLLGVGIVLFRQQTPQAHTWSETELAQIRSLSIDLLPETPVDPSNAVADVDDAVLLGHQLYFDARFSGNGQFSCASCHQPDNYFTDGLPKAQAMGPGTRNTPTLVGLAYNSWFYWDGRKDSQWAQALAPMEAGNEQAGNRTQYAHLIAENYRGQYEALFGPLPDLSHLPRSAGPVDDPEAAAAWEAMSSADQKLVNQIFANVGKVLAAYQRQLLPGRSQFDAYAAALADGDIDAAIEIFTADEAAGLRLFLGKANCVECHNGPLFTNGDFHNIGLPLEDAEIEGGRIEGVKTALADPFGCLGDFSDADESACAETRFAKTEGQELIGAFKTPSLRNVAATAPYMHNGIFPTLDAVLAHYNAAPPAFPGHSDLEPLGLEQQELEQLKAFLLTLSAEPDVPPELLSSPRASDQTGS